MNEVEFAMMERSETEKYNRVWQDERYRVSNHSLKCLDKWEKRFDVESVIDIGCGTGAFALEMHNQGKETWAVDIADNAPSEKCRQALGDRLIIAPLWCTLPIPEPVQLGVCCDVMEHIPEEAVGLVFETIASWCDRLFLQIATRKDKFGLRELDGLQLHMTVKRAEWWYERAREIPNKEYVEIIHADGRDFVIEVR